MLYSGPLSEAKVIFPVGEFKLYAEIHEEAGAYATYVINPKFSTVLPDEDDYNNANIEELLKQYRHNFLRKKLILTFCEIKCLKILMKYLCYDSRKIKDSKN